MHSTQWVTHAQPSAWDIMRSITRSCVDADLHAPTCSCVDAGLHAVVLMLTSGWAEQLRRVSLSSAVGGWAAPP